MAIDFSKKTYTGRVPKIWRGECKILPGGFTPVQDFESGTVIPQGTPLYVDFDEQTAAIVKTATVLDGSTTTAINVAKGLLFQAGDEISVYGDSSTATISTVDTDSSTEYDIINLSSALSVSEGDVLVESAGYTPNTVVGADLEIGDQGITTIDAAYEALVLYPNTDAPILDDWKTGFCLTNNPSIKFIKQ